MIDVSAHGVDRRQCAEPHKYIGAANIPGMDDAIAAGKRRECLRTWVSEIAPMVRIMPDYKRTACPGRLLSWLQPATVDHFVGRVRRVLQSLRRFGSCQKKQCRIASLSNPA